MFHYLLKFKRIKYKKNVYKIPNKLENVKKCLNFIDKIIIISLSNKSNKSDISKNCKVNWILNVRFVCVNNISNAKIGIVQHSWRRTNLETKNSSSSRTTRFYSTTQCILILEMLYRREYCNRSWTLSINYPVM